jgi:hypothetical protein
VIGGLNEKTILELGPFEGYDAYTFDRLGAAFVLSIESNVTNFLKCLIIKNIFGLRTTFLLGDFIQFLEKSSARFDVCWMVRRFLSHDRSDRATTCCLAYIGHSVHLDALL